jgi:hypothetical protein
MEAAIRRGQEEMKATLLLPPPPCDNTFSCFDILVKLFRVIFNRAIRYDLQISDDGILIYNYHNSGHYIFYLMHYI